MRGMSSDGATDKPRSSRPSRGEDRGIAGIALAVLLVLALIATVVMIFSDNAVWMRIGTLAALWAAFIGVFLVARYRRQATSEAARVRDLHTVYELQLEREISARREHELVVEKDLRDSIRVETSDSIHALRQEIAALREQLGQLGVSLPEDRFAVSGHTTAGELGAASALQSVPSERVAPRRRSAESTDPAGSPESSASDAGLVGTVGSDPSATGVRREATPSTERTEKFSPVDAQSGRARETYREQKRGPAVRPATRPQPVADAQNAPTPETPGPATTERPTTQTSTTPDQAPASPSAPAEPTRPEPTRPEPAASTSTQPPVSSRQPEPQEAPAAAASGPTSRHGEGGGLSVAELMARLGGDDDTPASGRRRRRAED